MSTRPETTYDDATTASPPTEAATRDFSATPTGSDATTTSPDATTSDATPTPGEGVPWTERCARQFATGDRARCRNLADDENEAMPDGV